MKSTRPHGQALRPHVGMADAPWKGRPGALLPTTTYRGHIRVWRGHLHQVDVVGGILPGGVVVIDVQEGDVDL